MTIAAVNGYALGGGCELALAADFRFVSERATLGLPEIQLGIIPGGGGTQRLPRLIGPARAKEMIFTGRNVKAEEALAIGLVDAVFPAGELLERALEAARRYASGPLVALRAAKALVNRSSGDIEVSRCCSARRTGGPAWPASPRTARGRPPSREGSGRGRKPHPANAAPAELRSRSRAGARTATDLGGGGRPRPGSGRYTAKQLAVPS